MLEPGTIVGERYTIKSQIGQGGMGTVYCARDERLGRDVALKVLRADIAADATERNRFIREGQIAAQIAHPNVVRTYDAGDDPAGPFLVQEFLTGQTLDQLIPQPPRRAAGILLGIAAALGYMHSRGLVHCDVKPQNILLRDSGTPVLLDFGIARAEGTAQTTLIATPHYLAPERAKGAAPSAASDLYALGIVLYQTIAGSPPFDAPDVHAIIQQHINLPVPALAGSDPLIPVLNRIVARLTAKQPADRYPSAEALQEDLAAVERNQLHAQPTVAVEQLQVRPASALRTTVPPALNTALAAWSAMPAWDRRRWLVIVAVPLILLLIGASLIRARRNTPAAEGAQPVPAQAPAATTPQMTTIDVPDVKGLQYTAASQLLAQHGLVAQLGDERVAPAAPGIVIEMQPAAASTLPAGDVVILHVSAGASTAADTPPASEPVAPPANPVAPGDNNAGNPPGKDKGHDNGKDKDKDQDDD